MPELGLYELQFSITHFLIALYFAFHFRFKFLYIVWLTIAGVELMKTSLFNTYVFSPIVSLSTTLIIVSLSFLFNKKGI